MYNIELKSNEQIIEIFDDILLKTGNDNINVSVILTNIRFIILSIPKDKESFRVGRVINNPNYKEIIFETDINNIIDIEKEDDYYKYILKDTNYFYLNSNKIYNFLHQNK